MRTGDRRVGLIGHRHATIAPIVRVDAPSSRGRDVCKIVDIDRAIDVGIADAGVARVIPGGKPLRLIAAGRQMRAGIDRAAGGQADGRARCDRDCRRQVDGLEAGGTGIDNIARDSGNRNTADAIAQCFNAERVVGYDRGAGEVLDRDVAAAVGVGADSIATCRIDIGRVVDGDVAEYGGVRRVGGAASVARQNSGRPRTGAGQQVAGVMVPAAVTVMLLVVTPPCCGMDVA